MAVRKKVRKTEYLNSTNAQGVANRGMNAAFSQASGYLVKNQDTGKWEDGGGYTSTKSGRLSIDGRRAGGLTHAQTPKNDDGSPVMKNGKARQSGRSGLATRRQRYYDVRVGLSLSGG